MEGNWKQTMQCWETRSQVLWITPSTLLQHIQEFLDKAGVEYKAKLTESEQITLLFSVWCSDQTNLVQVSPAVPRRPASSLGGGGGGGGGLLLPEDRGVDDGGGGGRRRGLHHSRSMGGEGGGEKAPSLARDSHPILKSRSNCWAILQCRESLCG